MSYAWLIWSLILLLFWLILYSLNRDMRKEMFYVSIWTMPLGLTEPLFVPEYWNPPSLFQLAQKTGFDIESLIFCFAIGGIAFIIYRSIFPYHYTEMSFSERAHKKHRLHKAILFSPAILFSILALFTELNHIYCAIIAMFLGALMTLYCRPDLKIKIFVGGFIFLILYTLIFLSLVWVWPNYIKLVWNLSELTGIYLFKIPIEEYLFAISFGMLWSSIYEHFSWLKIIRSNKA